MMGIRFCPKPPFGKRAGLLAADRPLRVGLETPSRAVVSHCRHKLHHADTDLRSVLASLYAGPTLQHRG